MSTQSRIKNAFSEYTAKLTVIDNDVKFKQKLNLGEDAFVYLKKVSNLQAFIHVISGGGSAASITYFGWAGSLGLMGKFGLAVGIVSAPVGLIAIAGGLGAASVFAFNKFTKKIDNDAYIKVPKFINTPLDILAVDILQTILPVSLKVAMADGTLTEAENIFMLDTLTDSWGFNRDFVENEIAILINQTSDYSYSDLNNYIENKFASNQDVNLPNLKSFLVEISQGIIKADNIITESETMEINRLKKSLLLT